MAVSRATRTNATCEGKSSDPQRFPNTMLERELFRRPSMAPYPARLNAGQVLAGGHEESFGACNGKGRLYCEVVVEKGSLALFFSKVAMSLLGHCNVGPALHAPPPRTAESVSWTLFSENFWGPGRDSTYFSLDNSTLVLPRLSDSQYLR